MEDGELLHADFYNHLNANIIFNCFCFNKVSVLVGVTNPSSDDLSTILALR